MSAADFDFLSRNRAWIEAENARVKDDRILVVSWQIRTALYDLLHEEIQRLQAEARATKRGTLRAKFNARSDRFRALADELAR